jgi:hypothetical protein
VDEHARIIEEARRRVARGETLDAEALERRIRSVEGASMELALRQLARIASVQRARSRLAGPSPAEAAPAANRAPRKPLLKTRPTVTANMDVRRDPTGGGFVLTWPAEPKVAAWDVRFSERPDARGDYVVREERRLAGDATAVELPLGDIPFRVHLLGRDRAGRLIRRAIVSALTRETWGDRWERRASAS